MVLFFKSSALCLIIKITMAMNFSLSVDTEKVDHLIYYFDEKVEADINRWHELKDPLRNRLYDRMREMAKEGKKIKEEKEGDGENHG